MKVRASVKNSPDDQVVRRKGRVYVINKNKPGTSKGKAVTRWLELVNHHSK